MIKKLNYTIWITWPSRCLLAGLLSACQTITNSTDQTAVGEINRILSSPIEKIFNSNSNGSIESYLSNLDRENMAKMTQNAVDTDRPQVFYNPDSGIQGQAEIIQLEMLSMQETGQKDKVQKCKIIRQIITFKDGREISENTTICRKLDK